MTPLKEVVPSPVPLRTATLSCGAHRFSRPRYCDCFANGEFCNSCNCTNCYNNLEHENERQKAIKVTLGTTSAWQASCSASSWLSASILQRKLIALCRVEVQSLVMWRGLISDLFWQACLDRNPEAFKPKIGKGKEGESDRRHSKGCNCKRSGCLKNYCECYEVRWVGKMI